MVCTYLQNEEVNIKFYDKQIDHNDYFSYRYDTFTSTIVYLHTFRHNNMLWSANAVLSFKLNFIVLNMSWQCKIAP